MSYDIASPTQTAFLINSTLHLAYMFGFEMGNREDTLLSVRRVKGESGDSNVSTSIVY